MNVLTVENVLLIVGSLIVFLMLVAFSMVLHANWDRVVYILAPLIDAIKHATYVEHREKTNEHNSGTEYRDIPDTYQPEPASTNAASTSILLASTADLVRHLAGLRKTNGDYAMSGNRIVAAVEMGRNEVLAIVREVRGTPEPVAAGTHHFEQNGPRQTFKRTGVRPLR